MDRSTYLAGILSLYQGEVLGEGLASRWIELTADARERYKLGMFLQLEAEAKVRLRPLLARYGLSLVEDERERAAGMASAQRFAALPWKHAMALLADLAVPYAERYQALAEVAPPEDSPLIDFMVTHEQAIIRIARREAAGESVMERELSVMLAHPMTPPP